MISKAGVYSEPVTVFRGINMGGRLTGEERIGLPPGGGAKEDAIRQKVARDAARWFPVGSEVQLGGFQSCSFDPTPALDASLSKESPGLIFEIRATRGAPMQSLSAQDDESELLLSDDTTYEVVGMLPQAQFAKGFDSEVPRTVVQLEQKE